MIKTLHGLSTMHGNMQTDIRLARECGYEALEMTELKLLRYLDSGCKVNELLVLFERYNIKPVCINALKGVERLNEGKTELLHEAEVLIDAAAALHCPVIQLVPFCGLEGRPYSEVRELTAANIAAVADMGKEFDIRFQLEPIAWSPIHSLAQSLEVLDEAGRDNVGMVIDFWHLWAGEETKPADIARLDKSLIYGVHFCDGIRPENGAGFDEAKLRGYLPGDGAIPVQDWVDAVLATGYEGSWSSELYSPRHWEWDLKDIAVESLKRMEQYL